MPQENNVRSVERALQILNCFTNGKGGLTLADISRMLDLSPSTVLRIIGTLQRENYLFRDPNDLRYYLGFKLAQIGHAAFANMDVVQITHPHLEELVREFGESTGLYLRQGEYRICIDREDGIKSLRSIVQVGNSAPLTRGASGRVLLSGMPESFIREQLEKDGFFTMEQIQKTREDGYAVSYGEREKGVVSIAAPIWNSLGEIFAAIFISGPDARMNQDLIKKMIPSVTRVGREVSNLMGYSSTPDTPVPYS